MSQNLPNGSLQIDVIHSGFTVKIQKGIILMVADGRSWFLLVEKDNLLFFLKNITRWWTNVNIFWNQEFKTGEHKKVLKTFRKNLILT